MSHRTCRAVVASCLLAITNLVPSAARSEETANPYPGYVSATYANPANWLCRPDKDDVCDHEMDASVVRANGAVGTKRWKPARKPRFDCFYVYPTISTDPSGNSDLVPGEDQELYVVRQQAARFGAECRVFAPVYRQVTLTALVASLGGNPLPTDSALADADVLDAWKHYIANDAEGRPFVLIGHSQGASRLVTLIKSEIDANPTLRDRLISAILLGTSLQVPVGEDVGGDFTAVPLCRSRRQTGCAISYATFRSMAPPPANSRFGRSRQPGWQAACTNPAALAGGTGDLHPYLPTEGRSLPIQPLPPPIVWSQGKTIITPFVTLPRFLAAACAEHDGFVYLSLTVDGDPDDPRVDDIGGDLTPDWGLHLVDANVAMGDLVALVRTQARAWRSYGR